MVIGGLDQDGDGTVRCEEGCRAGADADEEGKTYFLPRRLGWWGSAGVVCDGLGGGVLEGVPCLRGALRFCSRSKAGFIALLSSSSSSSSLSGFAASMVDTTKNGWFSHRRHVSVGKYK